MRRARAADRRRAVTNPGVAAPERVTFSAFERPFAGPYREG
jgi:hypothetical protein